MAKQKKYEFTGETKIEFGVKLHRIRALVAIAAIGVAAGDLGGWVGSEKNLSHDGNAWVYGNARVDGNARVTGNARVDGDARVFGDARVCGPIITASRSDGYTFTIFIEQSGALKITAGCRFFTPDEARQHWRSTRGGTKLGDESLLIVDHLERMAALQN